MESSSIGWPLLLGGALVSVSLTAGWVAGRVSARNADGPRERTFVRRTCLSTWGLLGLFLLSAILLPAPFRFLIPALLLFAIPALLYRWSIQRQLIRKRESRLKR